MESNKKNITLTEDQLLDVIITLNDCRQILLGNRTYYTPPYNENYAFIKSLNDLIYKLKFINSI